jgi:hypothetical protein
MLIGRQERQINRHERKAFSSGLSKKPCSSPAGAAYSSAYHHGTARPVRARFLSAHPIEDKSVVLLDKKIIRNRYDI